MIEALLHDDNLSPTRCRSARRACGRNCRALVQAAVPAAVRQRRLRQELLADLFRRLDHFEPARGSLGAFATVVLRNQSARIASRFVADRSKSGGPLLSLDMRVGPETLVGTLPDEGDTQDASERRIDVDRIVSRLPLRDRAFCVAIARWPVDRLVAQGFGSRAGLYRRLHELRHVLAANGLQVAA